MTLTKFKTTPYKHQLECLNRFGRKDYFALLAEMGTGKTWIIINNIADLWGSGDCDTALVFAPNGVHTNWTRLELPKHMPDWVRFRSAAWVADPKKSERDALERILVDRDGALRVLTMNWEALQTKRGMEFAERFIKSGAKPMIVCDESDAIKNPTAARTKALMKLRPHSKWRRIMSGTPINNAPFDAFSQFGFLDPSILETTSFYAFKAEYAELLPANHHTIKSIVTKKVQMSDSDRSLLAEAVRDLRGLVYANGRDELIQFMQAVHEAHEGGDYERVLMAVRSLKAMFQPGPAPATSKKAQALRAIACIDSICGAYSQRLGAAFNPNRIPQIVDRDKTGRPKFRNLDKLSRLIAPHSFRVLKSDCLDLPDKVYKTVLFDLTPQQRAAYKKAEDECRLVFQGDEAPISKLVAVSKLAQITSGYYIHPDCPDEPVRIEGDNPKLDALIDRVRAITDAGEKVIVWARYRIEIEDIVARLASEGIECVQYHGGVKKGDRVEAIEQFERGNAQVFVGNQQAGGTGITLVSASYVIYFSNNFSLRDRLQSEDRAHRIGQTKTVTYINLAAQGTVDEKVVSALSAKKDVAETIIDVGLALFNQD